MWKWLNFFRHKPKNYRGEAPKKIKLAILVFLSPDIYFKIVEDCKAETLITIIEWVCYNYIIDISD